jgi:lipopolysaccharide/colanic/teichoic acid biosynthesis glycosyltransferase
VALADDESAVIVAAAEFRQQGTASVPVAQRCLDVALTLLLTPVIIIVGAAIALAIYIDSPGPVIYRSERVGRNGRPFEMLKFRKMRREADNGPVTLDDDHRFTPIGRFLAATRLDELPQAWNVLRGDMRLVGPRPELECFVSQYAEQYQEILTVTPGVTGSAQLRFVDEKHLLGGPDPETTYRTQVLPAKLEIDLAYARSHSLAGDIRILIRTAALPFALLFERLHHRSGWQQWLPVTTAALLLAVVFVAFSSQLP